MKLYCLSLSGLTIPHYGTREYGGYWENLPPDVFNELKERDDFSVTNPIKETKHAEKAAKEDNT